MNELDFVYDNGILSELTELVHTLTNKRFKYSDDVALRKIETICENECNYLRRLYSLIYENMKRNHSEIRYNAFVLLDSFVRKFIRFRKLVIDDLSSILDLTVDLDFNKTLPPPKVAAVELKCLVLRTIKDWKDKYGSSDCRIFQCYHYLLKRKRVDFEKLEIENVAVLRKREEERIRTVEKTRKLTTEIDEFKSEIENTKKSLDSCLSLLVPKPEEFFINEVSSDQDELNNLVLSKQQLSSDDIVEEDTNTSNREIGFPVGMHSINILLPKEHDKRIKIVESEENAIVIENAKDYCKILRNKYQDKIKNWLTSMMKCSEDITQLKQLIDLKNSVATSIKMFDTLLFVAPEDLNDDESDLEEVEPEAPTADDELISLLRTEDAMPSTSGCYAKANASLNYSKNIQTAEAADRKTELLKIAPKVPFDVDLYHWEEENLTTPMLLPVTAEGRQFWSASRMEDTDGIPMPDGTASLRTRRIEFTGNFEPVKWSCRFPLPSGKLCPRRDRYKCPFHGQIVGRDENGRCTNPEDDKTDEKLRVKLQLDDAQDPQLLAEIKHATGVDLLISKKNKKRKKDNCELTDINKEENTVYKRLSKHLFKKSTVKRVATTLDNIDRKKYLDKFGDQFQYVHGTM